MNYIGINSYIFVNGVEIYKFKSKYSEINAVSLCLGDVSKYVSVVNMKKAGLYGYLYNFLVDYDSIDIVNILNIHKKLMKKII